MFRSLSLSNLVDLYGDDRTGRRFIPGSNVRVSCFVFIDPLHSIEVFLVTPLRITVGYHRLYSHQAFRANPVVRTALALCGASACQGSIKVFTSVFILYQTSYVNIWPFMPI